jgi:hypothetical protein
LADQSEQCCSGHAAEPHKQAGVAEDIAAAEKDCEEPASEEQARAGNYRHGHVRLHGLDVTLETAKGMTRRGTDKDGKPWSITMKHSYGYVRRTKSEADEDHFDVFLGEHPESELVFVVDQYINGEFDEHKGILGCLSKEEAKATYLANYEDGWKGCGDITSLTMPQFKQWVRSGDTSKPLAGQKLQFEQNPARKALISYIQRRKSAQEKQAISAKLVANALAKAKNLGGGRWGQLAETTQRWLPGAANRAQDAYAAVKTTAPEMLRSGNRVPVQNALGELAQRPVQLRPTTGGSYAAGSEIGLSPSSRAPSMFHELGHVIDGATPQGQARLLNYASVPRARYGAEVMANRRAIQALQSQSPALGRLQQAGVTPPSPNQYRGFAQAQMENYRLKALAQGFTAAPGTPQPGFVNRAMNGSPVAAAAPAVKPMLSQPQPVNTLPKPQPFSSVARQPMNRPGGAIAPRLLQSSQQKMLPTGQVGTFQSGNFVPST